MAVSQKEKMFFAEHLSLMLKGGASLAEVLEVLRAEAKSKTLKKALADILKRTLEGESLHASLGRHPRIFNAFFRNIVKVGEESGTLEENLKYLSESLSNDYSLGRKVLGALIYPFFIILVAVVVIIVVVFFVLPKILNLFRGLGVQLPLSTRILVGSAVFIQKYWFVFLAVLILTPIIYKVLQKNKSFKLFSHNRMLHLPFFGPIVKNVMLARFSRTFFTLTKSGIPILEAFDICIDTLPNEAYRQKLSIVRRNIEKGERVSESVKKFPSFFPPMFIEMLVVGERSGSLEDSLLYLASFYEREVDNSLKNVANIIEPVLLIFVGVFVAFVVLAIVLPIYKFTAGIKIR